MKNKMPVTLDFLKELAVSAKLRGTTDAFISLALEWAEEANKEVGNLRKENLKLKEQVVLWEEEAKLYASNAEYWRSMSTHS